MPGYLPFTAADLDASILQAASKLDLTMHPAGSGPNRIWKHLCKDVVGTFPTQMLRASLVSSIVVGRDLASSSLSCFAAEGISHSFILS